MTLHRDFGRIAFGADAENYHRARPAYPAAVWSALRERAGLGPQIDILEIGAGTGLATGPLLAERPHRLTAVEPDGRLAAFLRAEHVDARLELIVSRFEIADLPVEAFDLVVSATAFHWLDAVPALNRIATLVRPGGHVALWWNVFGDDERPDPFHEATAHLFAGTATAADQPTKRPPEHALDVQRRLTDFSTSGWIADQPQFERWTLTLDAAGVRALYATFSNVSALDEGPRNRLLDRLAEIAADRFGGRVDRNMTTAIYTARRP